MADRKTGAVLCKLKMRLLGIDYGTKHVGVAYSDGIYAQPLVGLHAHEALVRLTLICKEKQIEKIVVGKPEGRFVVQAKKFADRLKMQVTCPVEFWDETLSSKAAISELVAQDRTRKRRKAKEHEVAAALILQTYLDAPRY